ncbi:MAG: hypothetical protein NC247_04905 [Ruminococcus flavefaciens]|nr:hypothetical protein [Ruminococcus flavefaciens]MCM1361047.1 hypothetical protein [Clostridiales bacterium]
MEWEIYNADAKPAIGKQYLVHVLFGLDFVETYLGEFDGEKWNLFDNAEDLTYTESNGIPDYCKITEYAELPDFDNESLVENPQNGRYLISVRFNGNNQYRTMIGELLDNCWSVGDTKEAFELYTDEINDIKVMLMP